MRPYVLSLVAEPPQRLGTSQSAFIYPVILSILVGVLLGIVEAFIAFIGLHILMIILYNQDPYFIEVLRARLKYKRTKRQLPRGGNLYGA